LETPYTAEFYLTFLFLPVVAGILALAART
jgi:hypothetical protein